MEPIPKQLFEILACPVCKGKLSYNKDKKNLVCKGCDNKYPIKDGIAVLMPGKDKKDL